MIGRLCRDIADFALSLFPRRRVRPVPAPGNGAKSGDEQKAPLPCGAIKGNMRNVIVLHPKDGVFTEAVFLLRDDYLSSPGISREELLRQARAAAEEYTCAAMYTGRKRPAGRVRRAFIVALLLLTALAAVKYTGVI